MTEDDLQMFAVVVAKAMGDAMHRRVMLHITKEAVHGSVSVAEVEAAMLGPVAFDVFDNPRIGERIAELMAKVSP